MLGSPPPQGAGRARTLLTPPPCRRPRAHRSVPVCKRAMNEFFQRTGISPTLHAIDNDGVFFQKTSAAHKADVAWYRAFNASRTLDDAEGASDEW